MRTILKWTIGYPFLAIYTVAFLFAKLVQIGFCALVRLFQRKQ